MKIDKLDEFSLIAKIVRTKSYFDSKGIVGPGDDCAVFGDNLLITTDTLLENRHFKLEYSSLSDIGWKSLAVSLSDIAAMCGKPEIVTVAIQLPEDIDIVEIYKGIYELADLFQVEIVGGDTVKSEKLGITTTVVGKTIKRPILRSGAKLNDDLWLSDQVGLAQLGLESFSNNNYNELRRYHQRPMPHLGVIGLIKDHANSMIDVSDGLFQDLMHICNASNLSASIDLDMIPCPIAYSQSKQDFLRLCTSGDDYVLLFSAAKECRENLATSKSFKLIGEFVESTKQPEIYVKSELLTDILRENHIERLGYSHF